MQIRCTPSYVLYPKTPHPFGYMVVLYKAAGADLVFPDGTSAATFVSTGMNIAYDSHLQVLLDGEWVLTKKGRDKYAFQVSSCVEQKELGECGIISYLCSLDGVGPALAKRIFTMFGDETYKILDQCPEKLMTVKGVKTSTYQKIVESIAIRGKNRFVYELMAKVGLSPNQAKSIIGQYQDSAARILQENPYELIGKYGISFYMADAIFRTSSMYSQNALQRVMGGIEQVLLEAENGGRTFAHESSGHTCLEWPTLRRKSMELLDVSDECIVRATQALLASKQLFYGERRYFYRRPTAIAEYGVAVQLKRLCDAFIKSNGCNEQTVYAAERDNGIVLAKEQRMAVETVLRNNVTVITGGPGTGKTSILRIFLQALKAKKADLSVTLCAPTGRAARRMAESTGLSAGTIHQTLGLRVSDDTGELIGGDATVIDSDVVVVDEASMLDTYLASAFLSKITSGVRVVLIGDKDQLPSVGAGSVLREIIASDAVPVVTLTRVYRQKNGSEIALNAARIKQGMQTMGEGDSFVFMEAESEDETVQTIRAEYIKAVAQYGIDEVCVLSPFRKSTATCVDALNPILRRAVNRTVQTSPSFTVGKNKAFFLNDKVMYTKNMDDLANGDIGYVKEILPATDEEPSRLVIAFGGVGDRKIPEDKLRPLELAYACTVHKSQGSEYKCIILVVQDAHRVMLKRNLLYTAITRAKERVILVGSKQALRAGIAAESTDQRLSRLASVIRTRFAPQVRQSQ